MGNLLADPALLTASAPAESKVGQPDSVSAELHGAVAANDIQTVMMLLYGKELDLTSTNKDGSTLLHTACRVGSTLSVALLLEKEKSMVAIVMRDRDGNTPIEVAIQNEHKECAYVLAKKIMQIIAESPKSKACTIM